MRRPGERLTQVSRTRDDLSSDSDIPAPRVGAHYYVHGGQATVERVERDGSVRLLCDTRRFPAGLLLRWLGYTWRASYVESGVINLEPWGRTYLESRKLSNTWRTSRH